MDSSALPPGARLGEMEILRVVAVGGFGIVYLARDHSLDRDVALKEFMPSRLVGRNEGQHVTVRSVSDAETFALGLQSFVNEGKLLAKLSHPSVVKVYRFWEANGTAYMAMPYLRGPTLKDVRRSMSEPPTEVWLRSVIDPLLDALEMLHSEGFYHRDIAPDNVLVSDAGLPVLLDFGAARQLIADRTQSLTAVLKPHYAPIEQYAESKRLRQGPWTDLYALGALVTFLLDGLPPPPSTARSIHDERDALATRRIAGVSATFLSAIDWALAVKPQDRPQSVAQLRDALNGRVTASARDVAHQPAAGAGARTGPAIELASAFATTTGGTRPAAPDKRFAARPLTVAAVVLGAAVLAGAVWQSEPGPTLRARSQSAPINATARPADAPAPVPSVQAIERLPDLALPVGASPDMLAVDSSASSPEQLLLVRRQAESAKIHGASMKARAPSGQKTAERRKPAGAHVALSGPLALCASRNFFMRPFCVKRRCDEPRFKASSECMQVRQAGRFPRD
jgi:hypothetical protein